MKIVTITVCMNSTMAYMHRNTMLDLSYLPGTLAALVAPIATD